MERRELFRSFVKPFKKEEVIIVRPPYFLDKDDFIQNCVLCENQECVEVCEESIINIGSDKTPFLDFTKSGCTYCDECAMACLTDVLKIENKKYIDVKITIDMVKCVSWNNTMCFSCKDPCLDNAIDFTAMFKPTINDNCTSCGFCIGVCPTNAIKINQIDIKEL